MKIVELRTENFMGIKLAEIKPDGDMVVIGGRNGQGKTSLLDSIECAIRGKKFHPDKPVRDGAKSGEVSLDLGDLKILRKFNADGTGTITVERKDGFKAPRPQEVLDSLAGAISFDPLEFSRLDPKARLDLVRGLAGVDTRDLEQRRSVLYDERTAVNRATKNLDARLDTMDHYPDAPAVAVSVAALADELSKAEEHNRTRKRHHEESLSIEDSIDTSLDELTRMKESVAAVEEALAEKRVDLGVAFTAFEAMEEQDTDELRRAIEQSEAVNLQVAANLRRAEQSEEARSSAVHSSSLTEQIQSLDAEKAAVIAEASLPVPGLSFSESEGVTLDGIPFEQRSSSEKLDASIRIGMALNPKLHVMLVRDGCVLDGEAMERIGKVAHEEGYQLFIERVGTGDAGAIVIEEGEIVTEGEAV